MVPALTAAELSLPPPAETSADIAARVLDARERQRHRYAAHGLRCNAELVVKAVQLAGLFDKAPASPAEAREYLRLKGADRVAF